MIKKEDIPIVGGKGANLGEMSQKFPIPEGFCVTVNAYKEFMYQNKIWDKTLSLLSKTDVKNDKELEKSSAKIKNLILNSEIPSKTKAEIIGNYKNLGAKYVAVRSSATAEDLPNFSFAGQQESFLNVSGATDVIDSVRKCWASLFSPRSIYYRSMNKFEHEKVLISVVIQRMIDSQTSGVMFSANPVTKNKTEIMIEGSYGLGEAIVSGQVSPDNYTVDKKSLRIKSEKINLKKIMIVRNLNTGKTVKVQLEDKKAISRCLKNTEIKGLAKLAIKIESHYKKPQDIEWAIDSKGKISILQSRPITTL